MSKVSVKNYGFGKGSVLILVLIVISAMTIVAFGMAYQTRIEIRLSKLSSERAVLRNLVFSGLEAAKAILSEKELTVERTARVCRFYSAKDNRELFEQLRLGSDDDASVVFWIKDESSFLDLNKSDSAVWENLPGFGRDKRACVLDWMDADSETGPDGAEADYYERLEVPYECKNASLVFLKEMLLVKNMSREDYLGNILSEKILDAEETEFFLYEDSAERLALIKSFTTFGEGKVNINTVSGSLLSILPGLDEQAVGVVIGFRAGADGVEGTDDDRWFEKAEDILQIEGLGELQGELLGQYCCFGSDMFRVFSLAKKDEQVCLLMATVMAAENKAEVVCVERLL